jgi:hypothetical protein
MKLTSEIIQNNLDKLELMKKEFKILDDYEKESNQDRLSSLYSEGRNYGLSNYMMFIDFCRQVKNNKQQVFYSKKLKIKEFQEVIANNAIDTSVKNLLKSKGRVSFTKLINSQRWELYSGNVRRRGGVRYHDNFVSSAANIANFCIQNEIEVLNLSRISEWYKTPLQAIDLSIKKEIELTNDLVGFMFDSLSKQNYDFKKINVENISKFIYIEIKRKMTEIESGESVKLVEGADYYSALSFGKVYTVKSKDINSGRLNVTIENDLGFNRSYPYRIFETVTNLRNSALDELLNNL